MERKPFKPNALILQVYLFTAVYKTGAGTRGRGHWDACVRTCDLGTRSLRSCPFPIIPLCLSREEGMIHFFVGSHVKKPESTVRFATKNMCDEIKFVTIVKSFVV